MDNRLYIYLHIPKTGGSSVKNHFIRSFGAECVLSGYSEVLTHCERPLSERPVIRCISGHSAYYGIHRFFPEMEPYYFTFLRDPADRMVSGYNWDISVEDLDPVEFPFHLYLQWKADFMTDYLSKYMFNDHEKRIHASYLRSQWNYFLNRTVKRLGITSRFEPTPEQRLFRAKQILDRCAHVGLTEDIDRSLQIILGHQDPVVLERVNVTGDTSLPANNENGFIPRTIIRVRDIDKNMVYEYSKLDVELYRYAKELNRKQLN